MKAGELNPLLRQVLSELVDVSRRAGSLGELGEPEATSLKTEILDAFEKGNIDRALEQLLNRAPSRRARIAVEQLIDSALLSFGIDATAARATWQGAFNQLAAEATPTGEASDLRSSPIRDAFRGLTMQLDDRTLSHLKKLSHQQARLEASLNIALQSDDKTDALRELEQTLTLSQTPDNILMGFLGGYREEESWKDVIRLYEAAPVGFQDYSGPKQEYALALAMTGDHKRARAVLTDLTQEGDVSSATLGLLARLLKDHHDVLKKTNDPGATRVLAAAITAYRRSFLNDVSELYPGVALPVLLEAKGDPTSLNELREIASLVRTNAARRASFGERHFWDAAAALEMCCSLRDWPDAKLWLDRAMTSESEPWMRRSTLLNLNRLLDIRTSRGEDVSELKAVIDKLKTIPAEQKRSKKLPRESSSARIDGDLTSERALAAVLDTTYRFGGRSPKWLSGNYNYEGIAHDVRVTPADVVYFRRILKAAGIDQIGNPFEASKAMDQLIRGHFNTGSMEVKDSPDHQRYDRVMPGLKKLTAATRQNSQTNISADWINKLGDCRQHAPCKLMLWEAWKRGQINTLLAGIQEAVTAGRTMVAGKLEEAMREINSWEMRILDAELVNPSNGKLIEPHTMTLLVKRQVPQGEHGEMNQLDGAYLADSFYQNEHHLGDGKIEIQIKDGRLWIDVPEKSSGDRSIAIRPAPYSFDRAAPSFDFGQLKFRGVQVASPGWEHDIPVEGVDLQYLHNFVEAQNQAAGAVSAP